MMNRGAPIAGRRSLPRRAFGNDMARLVCSHLNQSRGRGQAKSDAKRPVGCKFNVRRRRAGRASGRRSPRSVRPPSASGKVPTAWCCRRCCPFRTSPPSPRLIPTIIRTGVKNARPRISETSSATPAKAHARPTTTSLRLRWIASLSSSICASSRSICSAGVGSASNMELSGGVGGRRVELK